MPLCAITYDVRPEYGEEIGEIFSPENFVRVDSPIMKDADGEEIGYLLGTGLFLHDGIVVRVIHHSGGTPEDIGRHMSTQEGVHEAEARLAPYLATARDTSTPAGFLAHFRRSLMTAVWQRTTDDRPTTGLLAFRHGLDLVTPEPDVTLDADAPTVATAALFTRGDTAIHVVAHDGHPYEVVLWLQRQAATPGWPGRADGAAEDPDTLLGRLHGQAMTSVAHLSAAGVA